MKLRIIGVLVAVALLILVVFSLPLVSFVATVERERVVTALERDAFMLAGHAKETLNTTAGSVLPSLAPVVEQYASSSDARIVVTNSSGLIVSSSEATVQIGADFTNRPEIVKALTGVPAVGERNSATLGETLVFVAVPVLLGDTVLGVVRLSSPKSAIDEQVRNRVVGIAIAGIFTLIAAVGVAIPLALTIARPISRLTRRTERLASGDFSVRADDSSGPPEVRELSRSFNSMAGRLGLVIENQRHFASAASHQLRTPLTALRLRLEQAQEMVPESATELGDTLEASRAEADRLQEMVEQLLALARLEGGSTATVTVNATKIIQSRAELWDSLAGERNVQIVVNVQNDVMCACVDGALEQIIDNFIDNALTVAPDNSQLEIKMGRRDNLVVIDVIDSGPGLSQADQKQAFERFWRGATTTNSAGTGLGLAIVQQLVTASGGTTELMSREDGLSGLVAHVSLVGR